MERIPRERLNNVERVPRDEVEEGEMYIFDWDPYGWAHENEGLEGRVVVTVTEENILGDIVMRAQDGTVLRDYGESRPQVAGPADNTEGVPDRTDVGMGGLYYPYSDAESSSDGASDFEMGVLPGGVGDRLTDDY